MWCLTIDSIQKNWVKLVPLTLFSALFSYICLTDLNLSMKPDSNLLTFDTIVTIAYIKFNCVLMYSRSADANVEESLQYSIYAFSDVGWWSTGSNGAHSVNHVRKSSSETAMLGSLVSAGMDGGDNSHSCANRASADRLHEPCWAVNRALNVSGLAKLA